MRVHVWATKDVTRARYQRTGRALVHEPTVRCPRLWWHAIRVCPLWRWHVRDIPRQASVICAELGAMVVEG